MRYLLLPVLVLVGYCCSAQQSFSFSCQKDTLVTGCSNTCITLQAKIPDLYGGTSISYSPITGNTPSGGCFQIPPVLPNGPGTSTALTIDDRYSSVITLPFSFNFFGTNYTQLVASTNGLLSFDITRANQFSHYAILNSGGGLSATSGTPQNLPSNLYDKALIMGPYHDIDPGYTTSPTQKIQYTVVGTAPYRKWVLSFYKVPLFDCSGSIENTHQIILNESTGIVQVLIYNKQVCTSWNQGRAMIGMQDMTRTQSVMVPGRRASDPAWTVTTNNGNTAPMESYSFVPFGSTAPGGGGVTSLFKRVELYNLSGSLVGTGTSVANNDGTRTASFANVCTPIGTSIFIVKSVYQKNDDPTVEIFGTDTLRIIKTGSALAATVAVQPSLCVPSGTITVNTTAGTAPFVYSLNGATYQSGNSFTNLAPGNYVVTVKDNNGCTVDVNAAVVLQNNLILKTANDTSICQGASFVANTNTNGASFTWSPTAGLSNSTASSPSVSPQQTTSYVVTATLGNCQAKDTLNVTVFPGAVSNAGPDQTIIAGDQIQLQGSGSAGTYLWTPATGLSATNILQPTAAPTTTTTYSLKVTTNQGCTATDDVTVNVIPYCVKVMEAFTPNGDGINDLWLVTNGNCLKSAKAEVFNRYGNKVFESQDYKNNWNGTFNGKPLPDGTYYYVITYQLINGKLVYLKGNVTILR